jgi:hypothetical protein
MNKSQPVQAGEAAAVAARQTTAPSAHHIHIPRLPPPSPVHTKRRREERRSGEERRKRWPVLLEG